MSRDWERTEESKKRGFTFPDNVVSQMARCNHGGKSFPLYFPFAEGSFDIHPSTCRRSPVLGRTSYCIRTYEQIFDGREEKLEGRLLNFTQSIDPRGGGSHGKPVQEEAHRN